jgi:hypothetical protein
LQAAHTDTLRPRLRSFTPLPPQVVRTAGFYFIPASPAKYDISAFYLSAGTDEDAGTQRVTLTITAADVSFGGDTVPYALPPAAGAVPPPLAAPLKRFVTETVLVRLPRELVTPRFWELNLCTTAAASPPPPLPAADVAVSPDPHGWQLDLGKNPGDVRVRLFRLYRKNDATNDANNDPAFDLAYPAATYPSLKNVRSYLDRDIWIPVRDFAFTIEDLPQLTPDGKAVTIDSESVQKLDLGLVLQGDAKPNVVVTWDRAKPRPVPDEPIPVPIVERTHDGSAHPRGEVWQLRPLGGVLEEDSTYRVRVTFGKDPANQVFRILDVTVTPFIRLTGAGAHQFDAAVDAPCNLAIVGGTPPYTVSDNGLPADTKAVVDGTTVVVTVTRSPAAEKKVVLTVKDANGKTGKRTITVKKT